MLGGSPWNEVRLAATTGLQCLTVQRPRMHLQPVRMAMLRYCTSALAAFLQAQWGALLAAHFLSHKLRIEP